MGARRRARRHRRKRRSLPLSATSTSGDGNSGPCFREWSASAGVLDAIGDRRLKLGEILDLVARSFDEEPVRPMAAWQAAGLPRPLVKGRGPVVASGRESVQRAGPAIR
jgi:hypothetical protein